VLKSKLEVWAKENPGAQAELALLISRQLGDKDAKTRWSLVDIRSEFQARAQQTNITFWKILSSGLVAAYLFPVVLAWYHLWRAFKEFREVSLALPEGVSVDFLTFWNKGYADELRQLDGMPISQVAFWIALFVLLLLLAAAVIHYFEPDESVMTPELNNLILEVSLELGSSRAVRPEEIAEVLKSSGQKLKEGIDGLQTALTGTELIVAQVTHVSKSLSESSQMIDTASRGLRDSLEPLVGFAEVARSAESGFRSAGDYIKDAASTLSQGVTDNVRGFSQIVTDAASLSRTLEDSRSSLERVMQSNSTVVDRANQLGDKFSQIIQKSDDVNQKTAVFVSRLDAVIDKVGQYTAGLDDPKVEPHLLQLHDIAIMISNAVTEIRTTMESFQLELSEFRVSNGSS
jgi:ABC-type transporter Mla subunit MlaD